uniref:Uncharacterized protein n=1 Tax=Leersia perrieri TaxID=77586 RepID=A0A0D9VLT4_9ORYZ
MLKYVAAAGGRAIEQEAQATADRKTLRRLRLRWWVAAKYRRLRACYAKAIRDVLEGAVRADAGV